MIRIEDELSDSLVRSPECVNMIDQALKVQMQQATEKAKQLALSEVFFFLPKQERTHAQLLAKQTAELRLRERSNYFLSQKLEHITNVCFSFVFLSCSFFLS